MLTRIDLRHFKCFETLKLPLCALTLLSGANASGKSSVMQALVLLHQTMREHEWSSRLMLNGSAVRLGAVADVVDQVHGRRDCGIALLDDDAASYQWEFEGERDEMSMAVRRAHGETGAGDGWDVDGSQPIHHLLPPPAGDPSLTSRLRKLTYLPAERLGPRELYAFDDPQLTPVVGPRGEYAVSVLHSGRDVRVLKRLAIDATGVRTPEGQRVYQDYFTGENALFSDSSDNEKRRFGEALTFPHPSEPGNSLACPWHGKVRHMTLRLHFSWPIEPGKPVYVVYAGPKLTRR